LRYQPDFIPLGFGYFTPAAAADDPEPLKKALL